MISDHVPPPPTQYAEIRPIEANTDQKADSSLQNEINNFNPDAGTPTLRYEQPEPEKPEIGQREQALNENIEGIANGIAHAKELQDESEKSKEAQTAEALSKDGENSKTDDYECFNGIY